MRTIRGFVDIACADENKRHWFTVPSFRMCVGFLVAFVHKMSTHVYDFPLHIRIAVEEYRHFVVVVVVVYKWEALSEWGGETFQKVWRGFWFGVGIAMLWIVIVMQSVELWMALIYKLIWVWWLSIIDIISMLLFLLLYILFIYILDFVRMQINDGSDSAPVFCYFVWQSFRVSGRNIAHSTVSPNVYSNDYVYAR